MKKIILMMVVLGGMVSVMSSCSPKTTANGNVAAKKGQVTGNWVLNNITFEGVPETSIRSYLGESSYKCFVGSTWQLTNSGNGTYTLAEGGACGGKTQKIYWSIIPGEETFQYKVLNEGDKATKVTSGYKMIISSTDGNNMILKSPVSYGNKTAYVVMNFSKS